MVSQIVNYYHVIKFNFIISKIFGVCQFTINFRDVTQTPKVTLIDITILSFWSVFYGFDGYFSSSLPYFTDTNTSIIFHIGNELLDKVALITQFGLIWFGFAYRGSIQELLKKIVQVDQMVC